MSCPTMVQVTNISPQASSQQMTELFSYLGDISSLKLFPEDDSKSVPSKVCFVDFKDENSAGTALHLTNTIFIDRALVISRSRYASIPVEEDAMSLAAPAVAIAANQTMSLGHTAPLLPTPTPAPLAVAPNNAGLGLAGPAPAVSTSMHMTPPTLPTQSPLISMMGTVVPPAPPLTGNVDPSKIEEIRRTVYVGNLNSSQITADQVLNFFLPCGEIKYVRMAGDETQPTRFVFVEFARPESVPIALQYNGAMFGDRPIKVNHSKNAIVKPQGPSAQETQREVDEAMKKVKEATLAISASIIPDTPKSKRSPSRSRSRSRSHDYRRHRSRSRSKDRYRRRSRSRSPFYSRGYRGNRRDYYSPSPPRRRRYSRSRSPRRRSRSPRRYSRSPRRYSRSPRRFSRSPVRRRSRSPMRRRSRSPRRRSRSPRRYRSRTPPRRRRERSHSRSRSPPSSREERKRKRGSSREKGASHKRTKRSRSPSSSKKSSHKKDRRRRSGSGSPGREAGSPERVSSSRTKKKKRHHRHKKHSPSPSPIASPSPSPPPKNRRAKNDDDDDNSSVTSKESVKSEQSSKGSPQRYSGREDSEMEEEEKLAGSRSSGSPSPTRNEMDSDSSYD